MIIIKKVSILLILLLLTLSYRGYIEFQNQKLIEERKLINQQLNEALESSVMDFNRTGYSKVSHEYFKRGNEVNETEKNKEIESYTVIGKLKIPKIDYDGIILDEATNENLKIGISRVVGSGVNQYGNLVLAGHYMSDGSLFGKLHFLDINDTFDLIDLSGNKKTYEIYRKKIVSPYDLSPLAQTKDQIKATLFTCTNNGKERLVLYAKVNEP